MKHEQTSLAVQFYLKLFIWTHSLSFPSSMKEQQLQHLRTTECVFQCNEDLRRSEGLDLRCRPHCLCNFTPEACLIKNENSLSKWHSLFQRYDHTDGNYIWFLLKCAQIGKYWNQMIFMTFSFINGSWTSSFVSASNSVYWFCYWIYSTTAKETVSAKLWACAWIECDERERMGSLKKWKTTHLSVVVSLLVAHNNKCRERDHSALFHD